MEETSPRTGLLVSAVVAAAVTTVVALVLVTLLLMDTHAEPGESSMEELRLEASASG